MMRDSRRRRITLLVGLLLGAVAAMVFSGSAAAGPQLSLKSGARGALDCNGFSPVQQSIKPTGVCTDIRGFPGDSANNEDGRFFDNGHYIGHDEPDLTFLSKKAGSRNDVTCTETLPMDPTS